MTLLCSRSYLHFLGYTLYIGMHDSNKTIIYWSVLYFVERGMYMYLSGLFLQVKHPQRLVWFFMSIMSGILTYGSSGTSYAPVWLITLEERSLALISRLQYYDINRTC